MSSSSTSTTPSPTSPTPLHATLVRTTHRFLSTFSPPSTASTSSINPINLHFTTTKNYTHTIGPAFFVASSPNKDHLANVQTAADFAKHLDRMSRAFVRSETWVRRTRATPTPTPTTEGGGVEGEEEIVVDVHRKVVVVDVVHRIVVKGQGDEKKRTVDNEVTWWLQMSGDGKLVERSREVVDGVASAEIARLVGVWRESVTGEV
ncbi:hypothetical protein DM02DRAFT_619160 [Periconia macrospinosa]|uniref:Uncharacterized protein n=1 Tax=Periconia macrospinosa TaxID=97972 RepID=A0A2V1D6E6_9PLEO|nr:hypothetical protein DM02DRAFT_619160 [Periconia macrospinosa]